MNLQQTIIEAPIDGSVIARNVDVGRRPRVVAGRTAARPRPPAQGRWSRTPTVAASVQAPTLFVIAADLTRMRVVADIDESDVGSIRPGQLARVRVDAYADEQFTGTVTQVRLQPKVVQNVVTYSTVIDVPNPELRLKPGLTATVAIEIARRAEAIRIPVAALRFRPSADLFAALNQAQPADAPRGAQQRAHSQSGIAGVAETSGTVSMVPSVAGAPAQTVDALFGPLPISETAGRVWRFVDGRLEPMQVRLGVSDGIYTEVIAGDVEPGTALVSAASAPASGSSAAVRSPLITPSRGPR